MTDSDYRKTTAQ